MSRLNTAARSSPVYTHEGAPAVRNLTPEQQLRRSVLSCLLWEREFYESGQTIADRISANAALVAPKTLASLAVEARTSFHLRHVPLLLIKTLVRTGAGDRLVADTIEAVVKRPDEMGELLAIYWADADNKHMLPAQMRKGLARAFRNFDEYQLAKYDRDSAVKLRDVLRLVRPKPIDKSQSQLFAAVKDRSLETPDTWEVALSSGADKRETFTRLIKEDRLGYLALLRNLRNMAEAGVDADLVKAAIIARKGSHNVLPFRYVAAARAAPQWEPALDEALCASVRELPVLPGKTIVLVDVSGSMSEKLSAKSDLRRMDAAATLAAIVPGDVRVFTFSVNIVEVPPRRGMAGVDAVINSQPHGGTYLGAAVRVMNEAKADRLIVISDEQSHDPVPAPTARFSYMINVASAQNGVGYERAGWTAHIDGFSERVLNYIREVEADLAGPPRKAVEVPRPAPKVERAPAKPKPKAKPRAAAKRTAKPKAKAKPARKTPKRR